MADQLSGCEADKVLDAPIRTIVECGLPGPLRTLLYVVVGLCGGLSPFIYKYYLGVLAQGAAQEGSIERKDYDRLRASLDGDNLAARLYAKWLSAFLDGIERFFGDAGMAERTLFPHAFGLKKPAPLWTAPAFDRCLMLALIYPIATIFVIWAISGHVGPAEAALGLQPNLSSGLSRGFITVACFGFASYTIWRGLRAPGWKSFALILVAVAGGVLGAMAVNIALVASKPYSANIIVSGVVLFLVLPLAVVFILSIVFADILPVAGAVAGALAIAGASAVGGADPEDVTSFVFGAFAGAGAMAGAVAVAGSGAGAVTGVVAVAVTGVVGFTGVVEVGASVGGNLAASAVGIAVGAGFAAFVARVVAFLYASAVDHGWQGRFLAFFIALATVASLLAVPFLAPLRAWDVGGPLLLFLGLLTLLNAPFDWASLGLTRALLRRGLELGGWWPYLLALADACLAGVIIALLALTIVISVQAFDELAVHGGGEKAAVLPLPALFDGIAKNPGAPEFWWVYALLLSTMIPSLINLAIGGMAFTRGIPGVSQLLLHWVPEGREVPDYRRPLAALVLTGQMYSGAFLGLAAQGLLAWGLIFHVMPWVGLDLLAMARAVAAAHVGRLFAGTL